MSHENQSPTGREIPAVKRIVLNDASQLPSNYSSTPGGTLFSTTPGGTRIVYDRSLLLQLRNSPLAKSPPRNMAKIPGITDFESSESQIANEKENGQKEETKEASKLVHDEHPQFEMDI